MAVSDSKYYLFLEMQRNMSKLVFEGQNGLSQITWHPSEKKSSIKRYDKKEILKKKTRLEMNLDLEIGYTHPFGHFPELRWTFTNVRLFYFSNITQFCHFACTFFTLSSYLLGNLL